MIIIDGKKSELKLTSFENLQDVLVTISADEDLNKRIITDVLVDGEQFSEIYPYQSEDIECTEINKVEVQSVPASEMALSISEELDKVSKIMRLGAKEVATLFRQADDSEALELFQDLIDVTRHFLGMIGILRNDYAGIDSISVFAAHVENISSLLGEMTEVLENEDWILLSDLLEYEFVPEVEGWDIIIAELKHNISALQNN